jgi:hypothetical protein
MGLDPSVELMEHAGGSFYHIQVDNALYKTLAILEDHRANALIGPGTRIFKVKRVDDNKDQMYVLKDLWLTMDQKPEHQIYQEIIEDIGSLYSNKDADTVKQHLLTPIDSMVVTINGVEDDTGTRKMQYYTLESPDEHGSEITKTHHRLHYCIVFEEYATPLSQVKMMGDVFTVLADLIKGQ